MQERCLREEPAAARAIRLPPSAPRRSTAKLAQGSANAHYRRSFAQPRQSSRRLLRRPRDKKPFEAVLACARNHASKAKFEVAPRTHEWTDPAVLARSPLPRRTTHSLPAALPSAKTILLECRL